MCGVVCCCTGGADVAKACKVAHGAVYFAVYGGWRGYGVDAVCQQLTGCKTARHEVMYWVHFCMLVKVARFCRDAPHGHLCLAMPTQACRSLPCGICTHAESFVLWCCCYTKGSGGVAADFRRAAAARYDRYRHMGKLFCPLSRPAGASGVLPICTYAWGGGCSVAPKVILWRGGGGCMG